jgi:hypothetical protein
MPGDDLLRFIGGPLAASWWWLVLAIVIVGAVVTWCVAVVVWTMPPQRLRAIPVIRDLHARLIRRRFIRSVQQITQRYRERTLSQAQAGAAYGRTVRSFLFLRTGVRAQYLHLADLTDGELSKAVPLLTVLDDAQFNTRSRADVTSLGRSAEELIRTWS